MKSFMDFAKVTFLALLVFTPGAFATASVTRNIECHDYTGANVVSFRAVLAKEINDMPTEQFFRSAALRKAVLENINLDGLRQYYIPKLQKHPVTSTATLARVSLSDALSAIALTFGYQMDWNGATLDQVVFELEGLVFVVPHTSGPRVQISNPELPYYRFQNARITITDDETLAVSRVLLICDLGMQK